MKSIAPAARRTNNNTHYTRRRFKTFMFLGALLIVVTAMAVPFDSVDSKSRGNTTDESVVQRNINTSIATMLSLPSMAGESVTL